MSHPLYTAFDEELLENLHYAWQQRINIALLHQRVALLTCVSRDLFSQYPHAEFFTLVGSQMKVHVNVHSEITTVAEALPQGPLLDGITCKLRRNSVDIS